MDFFLELNLYLFFAFIFLRNVSVTANTLEDVQYVLKCQHTVGSVPDFINSTKSGNVINLRIGESKYGGMNCAESDSFSLSINIGDEDQGNRSFVPEYSGEFTEEGSLLVKMRFGMPFLRSKGDYCVKSYFEENIILRVCPNECQGGCVQKCCAGNQILRHDAENRLVCQQNSKEANWTWNSSTFSRIYTNLDMTAGRPHYIMDALAKDNKGKDWVTYVHRQPQCEAPEPQHQNVTESKFHVINNGEIAFCRGRLWTLYDVGYKNFCVDIVQNYCEVGIQPCLANGTTYALLVAHVSNDYYDSFMNIPKETAEALESFQIIFYIFVPLSSFFLILVVFVHCLLWDKQNIHGYTITSYSISLILHYITWICIPLEDVLETDTHKVINDINEFFSYSTICWLTSINFDIWITFRKVQLSKSNSFKRFSYYAAFSLTIPLLAVLIGHLVSFYLHREDIDTCPDVDSRALPPVLTRFMESIFKRFLFFGILLACNFLFFVNTVYRMWKQNKRTDVVLQPTSNYLAQVLIKLSVVMGGCWLLDTIPLMLLFYIFWVGEDHYAVNVTKDLTRFLHKAIFCAWMSEAVTVFESIAIFYIFICKRSTFTNLGFKYPTLKKLGQ